VGNKGNKYCSPKCKGEHRKKNSPTYIVNCTECGKEINVKAISNNGVYSCSKECRDKHRKKHWGYDKKCVVCGNNFKTPIKSQRACSNLCEGSIRSQQARERNGDSFPNQRARVEYKRRQRKIKTLVEKVELNRLIVRDKGICQLCGELVDLRVHYNHHLAPTNDHIIPLALGGETSYENCQLAHRGCNSRKSHFVKGGE
jgi:5-methylcytosine-specific restriction endonuclease McrA